MHGAERSAGHPCPTLVPRWEISTAFPVAAREIRVAAHAPRTYRHRMLVAAAGIVGMAFALAGFSDLQGRSPHWLGQTVFLAGAWWVFFMAAAGFGPTCDAISAEKRAGTLGLLFLAGLKGREVVLGKLVSNGVLSFGGLIALFPVMTIPLLFGGIEPIQCARIFLSVMNMLFFACAAGLLASALSRTPQQAQSRSLQIVLVFTGVLPLAALVLRQYGFDPAWSLAVELFSPVYAQRTAFGALTGLQFFWFWLSAGLVFALGCGLLAAASWLAPRRWQEGKPVGLIHAMKERWGAVLAGTINTRSEQGRQTLAENPYRWLAVRDRGTARRTWMMIAAIVLGAIAVHFAVMSFFGWSSAKYLPAIALLFGYLMLTGLKTRMSGSAVASVAEAKENGTLELILASSVQIRQILTGQFRAARQLFGPQILAVTALLAAAFLLSIPGIDLLAEVFTNPPATGMFRLRAFLILAAFLLFLFLDAWAITWVGLCCGFRARTAALARTWAGFWVLGFPLMVFGAVVVILSMFPATQAYVQEFYSVLALGVAITAALELTLILYCRAWLHQAVQQTVSAPPEHTRSQGVLPTRAALRQFLASNLAILWMRKPRSY